MVKHVAGTLKELQGSEIYARIMDAKDPLDDLVEEVKGWWKYDLYGRRPARALVDGAGILIRPTDLDLACFLAALAERGAVINLPVYKNRRPRQLRDDEWVVSSGNRHGKLVGLTPNKGVFSFSTLIIDANVVRTTDGRDEVGAFRNFMVVDLDGHFYDGWKVIEFVPSRKENDFLSERGLWTGNKVVFDRFVHPNRWVSFFGAPYVLTKLLIGRLEEEAKDLYQQAREPAAAADEGDEEKGGVTTGPAVSEKVKAFEAQIDSPDGPPTGFPQLGLEAAKARLKKVRYGDVPELRFATRATELAFCNQARCFDTLAIEKSTDSGAEPPYHVVREREEPEPLPGWIRNARFEDHKIKRTVWRRLVLHQQEPFMKGLSLMYRTKWKTERVAA